MNVNKKPKYFLNIDFSLLGNRATKDYFRDSNPHCEARFIFGALKLATLILALQFLLTLALYTCIMLTLAILINRATEVKFFIEIQSVRK